jgi:hypothetical protein
MDGLGEEVVDEVAGLGATLALTDTRVIVVRQGAHFRPINGIRAWPYRAIRAVHLSPPMHHSGRIVLRVGLYPWQALSVFVDAEQWPAAERVVGQIRIRTAQARRVPPGKAPARTRPPVTG